MSVIMEKDEIVICSGSCKVKFHRTCTTVSKVLYDEMKKTSAVTFKCIKCQGDDKNVVALLEKLAIHMNKLEKINDDNFHKIETRLNIIDETLSRGDKPKPNEISVDDSATGNKMLFTEVVRKQKKKNKPTVVHVVPKDKTQKRETTKTSVKSAINPADFTIQGIKNAANGGLIIECCNEESCDKLLTAASERLGEKYQVQKPQKRQPRIKILKVNDPELDDNKFLEELIERNPILGMNQTNIELIKREEVKIKDKVVGNCFNIVLQVDGETYNKVMENGKLFCGWDRCKVVDNIYIRRCYNCYGFNHNAAVCRNKAVCGSCGSNEHQRKDCKANEEKCSNCCAANDKFKMHLTTNHNVWSKECKVYQRKMEISKRGIQYID